MHLVKNFGLIIWCCFLLIMLSFAADNQNADVIKHCMNSTNSTSCSLTYEHVYKSLTKNENSFNISHALYPEGGKPSFLVRVNVYGPNKTHNSVPAQFLWSIHCLFSNVPALALEMFSLGSIIVTSRTQELDVQIPLFCCNLSENIERRKEMIQGFLTRALFEVSADFVWISKGRPVLPRGGGGGGGGGFLGIHGEAYRPVLQISKSPKFRTNPGLPRGYLNPEPSFKQPGPDL